MVEQSPQNIGDGAGWKLVDPRPSVIEYPYTFFVPSDAEKNALEKEDLVKLVFEGPDSIERMWVTVKGRDEHVFFGELDNEPYEIAGLSRGDAIRFNDFHIVGIWEHKIPTEEGEDQYFARCHVDQRIVDGEARISHLERRKPRWRWWWQRKRERFPDTGWYIFADENGSNLGRKMVYRAIGSVLNRDDAFLEFLDAPVGTRLVREGDGFRMA